MTRRASTLVAWLALACAACSTDVNPATGRREVVLMSSADEQVLDTEQAKQVEASLGLVKDPELNAYVDAIGQMLASYSPRKDVDYHFQIVEMDEPNAFALPGGHIYVSRGLLVVANSEAELANVIGHEIGHVAARHHARQDAHVKTLGLASLLSDLMSGGEAESSPNEPLSGSFVARYARNQEREADRIGLELAAAAGVDPSGLGRFLGTLDQLQRLSQGFSTPQTYLSTHPADQERRIEAATRAQEHGWRSERAPLREWAAGRPVAATRDAFLAHLDGLTVGRPAAEGVFEGERFLHPNLGFSVQFPTGWRTLNMSNEVVAISPKRDAVALLQLDSHGDDPRAAAVAYAMREGLHLADDISLRVGGLPAYRARSLVPTGFGRIPAEITWIGFDGVIYRLIAGTQPGTLRSYEGIFRKFSHSFRPLTPEERAGIAELRLRLARVQTSGESIAELSARTGNQWDPAYTAVANGLAPAAPLLPGSLVKVAVREPYVPEPEQAPQPGPPAPGPEAAR